RDGGRQFVWQSERDGWRHLYRVSRDGKRIDPVTPGEYDVVELLHVDAKKGDPSKKWLYFMASPDNPTQRYLYRCRLDGTDRQRMTPEDQPGSHGYRISPDGRWAIHTRSSSGSPPVIDLVELPGHARVRTLVKNRELRKKVDRLKRQPVEFFRVDIGKGGMLDGWCMKPSDFDPAKKYPLLVYVYGEPAGQTVRDGWGGKGYLWHLMLAERGYLVMSFDNRGTAAPRGRAWRKAAYRKIGILAPADQAAALREVLHQRSYVDRTRIGIWGWSGGGSMSLNAIFKYPKLYHTAMAVASVSNQRYYDTIYQERYMDLPGDNVEGYTKGSPLNFAHRLQGNLLLVHGTGDDNCHYQATEVLIDELIRHNKQFTMMAYPNRSHSIREGSNTQRHLRQLLTSYLEENLPPGPAGE
ncbi:MAG: S9 family peptidase, partial [Planctomycetes bacterium]|nr:S9 family peptidase [Planctomycetota bacterium]